MWVAAPIDCPGDAPTFYYFACAVLALSWLHYVLLVAFYCAVCLRGREPDLPREADVAAFA